MEILQAALEFQVGLLGAIKRGVGGQKKKKNCLLHLQVPDLTG